MKNYSWILLILILVSPALLAQDASAIRKEITDYIAQNGLVPNIRDAKTIAKQTRVVKDTDRQVRHFLRSKDLSVKENRIQLFEIWSAGAAFDVTYMIAINNEDLLSAQYERLQDEITDLLRTNTQRVLKEDLLRIQRSLELAESDFLGLPQDGPKKPGQ